MSKSNLNLKLIYFDIDLAPVRYSNLGQKILGFELIVTSVVLYI